MKRSFAFLVAAGFMLAAPAALAAGETCDFNGDGVCDDADLAIIMDMATKQTHVGDSDFVAAADYDGDGGISLSDVSTFLDLRGQ
jgi:hypothetical protein